MLDVTFWASSWLPSPALLLQPADLSLLVAMPALCLLCLSQDSEHFQDVSEPRAAVAQQLMLSTAFCGLLPQLAVVPHSAADLPGLFAGRAMAGGLDPAWLQELQYCMQSSWAALGQEGQRKMLAMVRREAVPQLSPQAAALVDAFLEKPAGESS